MATESEKIVIEIDVDSGKALTALVEQKNAVEGLKKTNAELKKSQEELKSSGKENTQAYIDNAKAIAINETQIKTLNTQIGINQKIVQNANVGVNDQTGAYQRLSNQYSIAAQKAKDIAAVYGTNSEQFKKAAEEAKGLSDNLKKIDDSVGQNQRNVGNYTESINLLTGKFSSLPNSLGAVKEGFSAVGGALKGLIVQALAFIATPVGAVISAVAAAVTILYSVFKDFKPIVDKIEQSMAALGAVFDVVKNTIIGLFTGQKSLSESTKGLGTAMAGAAKEAANLKKAQQELEDTEGALEIQNKRSETQMQKLLLQSKNRTLSEKERMKMISDAQKIETDIHNRKLAQNNAEVANAEMALKIKLGLSQAEFKRLKKEGVAYAEKMQDSRTSAEEEIKTLKEALLKREDIAQESIAIQEKAQNRSDALEDAAKEKEEKAAEAAKAARQKRLEEREKQKEASLKKMEVTLQIYQEKNKTITVDSAKEIYRQELAIIEQKTKNNKLTTEEANLSKLQAENKYNASLLKITTDGTAAVLADLKDKIKKEQEEKDLSAQQRYAKLDEIYNVEIEAVKKLGGDTTEITKIYEDEKLKIKNETAAKKAELEIQAQNDLDALLAKNSFDAQQIALDNEYQQKMQAAQKVGADTTALTASYEQKKLLLKKKTTAAELSIANTATGQLAELLGKNTAAGKAAASAQVAIQTYQGSMAAWASAMELPTVIAPVVGAAMVGLTAATGLKNIAEIWKVSDSGTSSIANTSSSSSSTSSSVAGSIAQRTTTADTTTAVQTGVSSALQTTQQPQTVLVIDDVTDAINRKNTAKVSNGL